MIVVLDQGTLSDEAGKMTPKLIYEFVSFAEQEGFGAGGSKGTFETSELVVPIRRGGMRRDRVLVLRNGGRHWAQSCRTPRPIDNFIRVLYCTGHSS